MPAWQREVLPLVDCTRRASASQALQNANVAFGHCEPNPKPEQDEESNEWYVLVDDETWGNSAYRFDSWTGYCLHQAIDDILITRLAGEECKYALSEQGISGNFDQNAHEADQEQFRRIHLASRSVSTGPLDGRLIVAQGHSGMIAADRNFGLSRTTLRAIMRLHAHTFQRNAVHGFR